jgi:hypothetical protein
MVKRIRSGGLMRCCTSTIARHSGPETEGTTLSCDTCAAPMVIKAGAWEWYRPLSMENVDPPVELP